MNTPILRVNNIETYYGRIRALHGVSFEAPKGSITVILGNNGAGKSTILKTIMGLLDDQPDKGAIYFEEHEIQRRDTTHIVRRGIGYVPEGREILAELNVQENLQVGAYLRRDRRGIHEDLERMYRQFPPLAGRQRQLAGTLSGGEQQMLAIARAMMNRPRLLLLDEPSLGLSPALVREVFLMIQRIRQEGVTILLVEQNAHKALEVADFGLVLENGRIVFSGAAEEMRANEDVREFYLGVKTDESIKGYQRYKRKRRWR
jgi:branched-chain amino acid transport system ATP-binding protein